MSWLNKSPEREREEQTLQGDLHNRSFRLHFACLACIDKSRFPLREHQSFQALRTPTNMSDATTQVSEKAMASPSDSSPEPSMAQKPEAQEEEASTQDQAAFQPDTSDYPTGLNLYLITASLILVLFASNLDTTIM